MRSTLKYVGIFALAAIGSLPSAQASCSGCTAKNNMILFPNSAKDADVSLAWNYKGISDLDYAKMLIDGEYSQSVFENGDNMSKITNYLVNAEGKVLAEIPDIDPASPYGGIFGAAGISPNHRGSQYGEDTKQGFVYFTMETRWYTGSVHLYKKSGSGSSVSLAEVKGVGLAEFEKAYMSYLDKNFGKKSNYKRDKNSLAITFVPNIVDAKICKGKGVDLCLSVDADAEVPKGPEDDSFMNSAKAIVGIKLDGDQGALKVISVSERKEE
jgi:hypothetical protein